MHHLKRKLIFLTRLLGWLVCAPFQKKVKNSSVYSKKGKHWFVGYYDINCLRNEILYFHEVDKNSHLSPKKCNIMALNTNTGEVDKITETRAVNWQLGSRLNICEDEMVFNDIVENKLVHRTINLGSGKTKLYPMPYWLKNKRQDFTITMDYQRLWEERPGYGYDGKIHNDYKNCITIFNFQCTKQIASLRLERIIQELKLIGEGYLNHVIANFGASKIITTYNFNEGNSRRVVPIVYDVALNKLSTFNPGPTFSHPCFIDTKTIGYYDGDGYVSFDLQSRGKTTIYPTKRDGHPTFLNDTEFLTDSYPDKFSQMEVYLFRAGVKHTLFKHINPPWFIGDGRCDLHPRVYDSTLVVDLSLRNGRAIQLSALENNLHQKYTTF